MPAPVSLEDVILAGQQAFAEGLHTCMPARVISYDYLTQTCSVEPQVKRPLDTESDEVTHEVLPNIDSVPVVFPRGGGRVHTWPLEEGDFVLLVFSEVAIGEWRTTGQVSEPQDTRRHSMGYPFALPGISPDIAPIIPNTAPLVGGVSADKAIWGQENGHARIIEDGTTIQIGDGPPGPAGPDFLAKAGALGDIFTALQTQIMAIPGAAAPGPTYAAALLVLATTVAKGV